MKALLLASMLLASLSTFAQDSIVINIDNLVQSKAVHMKKIQEVAKDNHVSLQHERYQTEGVGEGYWFMSDEIGYIVRPVTKPAKNTTFPAKYTIQENRRSSEVVRGPKTIYYNEYRYQLIDNASGKVIKESEMLRKDFAGKTDSRKSSYTQYQVRHDRIGMGRADALVELIEFAAAL